MTTSAARLKPDRIMRFVETAYDSQSSDDDWRSQSIDALQAVVGGVSGAFCEFGIAERGEFKLNSLDSLKLRGPHVRAIADGGKAWSELPSELQTTLFGRSMAITIRSLIGVVEPVSIPAWRQVWRDPITDNLGIVVRDLKGPGSLIVVGTRQRIELNSRDRHLLDRVSFHASAAIRLRRDDAESGRLERAEAVLTPSGKTLHAVERAKSRRDELEDGRRRRREAHRAKDEPARALDIWQGLVAGRWSLVDFFDTDGKRLLLAMKNAPRVDKCADLTPRERRVAALAAMGHRDKEIAYMLGLSIGAVTAALVRARVKLDVRSRTDLAIAWRSSEKK